MMLKIFRILGESLYPDYRHNDFVLVATPAVFPRIRPGDAVVFQHIRYGLMIKKVDRILPESGEIFVLGNDPRSVDSRTFGCIRKEDLLGKVIWHIGGPGEAVLT